MDVRAEFKNGGVKLYLTPSDEWEQKLLGAVAKGGERLDAVVTYKPEGHFTYGKCAAVHVLLQPIESPNAELTGRLRSG